MVWLARLRSLLLMTLVLPAAAVAQPQAQGRWSAPFDMQGVGIHMTMLRGPADSWRVTWWSGFDGALVHSWDYRPGPFAFPSSFPWRTVHPTPDNFYECGFIPTADGRLLSLGGLNRYSNDGSRRAVIYSPRDSICSVAAPLAVERYEPSVTTLADGRVLVSGGIRYTYSILFGGRGPRPGVPGETESRRDLQRLARHPVPEWRDSTEDLWGSATRPPAMQGHTAVQDAAGGHRMIVYGGHDPSRPGQPDVWFDRVWRLRRSDEHLTAEVQWTWDSLATAPDPVAGRPVARDGHAAVLLSDRRMLMFGGRGAPGALADTWVLNVSGFESLAQPWSRWTPAPDPVWGVPAARWGHQLVLDAARNRVVLFGGRDAAGFHSDDCWQLTLGASPAWTRLPSSGAPREGHSALFSSSPYPRVWCYGGRSAAGLRADVMEYRLDTDTWRTPVLAAGSPVPPARAEHAVVLNGEGDMVVHGGELADGSLDDRLWRLRFVSPAQEASQLRWVLDPPGGYDPGPRAGHTLLGQDGLIFARRLEIYDPTGSTGALPGSTQELPASARRFTYYYAPMFLLPGGQVLGAYSGASGLLDLSNATWSSIAGGVPGGAAGQAVQYRPGRVMRCGGNFRPRATDVLNVAANGANTGWSTWTQGSIQTRILHRALMLPDGDVLVLGGSKDPSDLAGQRVPQTWRESAGWSDSTTFATEPLYRQYHSTAIVLPDARVLTAGGAFDPVAAFQGCVYEPRYLFESDGTLARQTVLADVPAVAGHGQTSTVTTVVPADVADIVGACLLAPGAVTHDANFSQRYVPLGFTLVPGGVQLTWPAPAEAPPGDYMLFLLRSSTNGAVPSIASWVRLAAPDATPPAIPQGFAGGRSGGTTTLRWNRNVESDLAGYRLYRGASADFVPGPTNLVASTADTFHVDAAPEGAWYKLAARDLSGNESGPAVLGPHELLGVTPGAASLALSPAHPNPAHGAWRVRFQLPRECTVRLEVLDIAGRRVATIADGTWPAGEHEVSAREHSVSRLASGRYVLRLTALGEVRTRSLLFIR